MQGNRLIRIWTDGWKERGMGSILHWVCVQDLHWVRAWKSLEKHCCWEGSSWKNSVRRLHRLRLLQHDLIISTRRMYRMDSSAIACVWSCGNQGETDGNGCAFPGFPICHSFDQVHYGLLYSLRSMCYPDSLNGLNCHPTVFAQEVFHFYWLWSQNPFNLDAYFMKSVRLCNG